MELTFPIDSQETNWIQSCGQWSEVNHQFAMGRIDLLSVTQCHIVLMIMEAWVCDRKQWPLSMWKKVFLASAVCQNGAHHFDFQTWPPNIKICVVLIWRGCGTEFRKHLNWLMSLKWIDLLVNHMLSLVTLKQGLLLTRMKMMCTRLLTVHTSQCPLHVLEVQLLLMWSMDLPSQMEKNWLWCDSKKSLDPVLSHEKMPAWLKKCGQSKSFLHFWKGFHGARSCKLAFWLILHLGISSQFSSHLVSAGLTQFVEASVGVAKEEGNSSQVNKVHDQFVAKQWQEECPKLTQSKSS